MHGAREAEAAYDTIAEAWAKTRSGPWPEVVEFLGRLPRGALVADVGGGSGRYAKVEQARGLRMVTLDVSRAQLAIARREVPEALLVRADAQHLPLRPGCAQAALFVAVVHHFERPEDRQAAWRELRRVLGPGRPLLATAWGTHDDTFKDARRAPRGGHNDFLVPFRAGQEAPVERFFHAYEPGELAGEATRAGFGAVREWEQRGNFVVEASP